MGLHHTRPYGSQTERVAAFTDWFHHCRGCRYTRNHVYAILATTTAALPETRHFPPLGPEFNRAISRMARRTGLDRIQQDVIVMHEDATAACAVFDEP